MYKSQTATAEVVAAMKVEGNQKILFSIPGKQHGTTQQATEGTGIVSLSRF